MPDYGVTGYLTPDNLPEDRHCRTFKIPNDVQWLSVFMGALLPLIYPESWQVYGELTPEEAADGMLDVIWDAYADDVGICPVVEAPFWDEVSDLDDELPEGESQPWYGVWEPVESGLLMAEDVEYEFHERIEDWAIAAFLAYSGSPAAALAFLTIAPKFRLAFKTHDLGGIIRVIVDAVEVGRVDTYSASPNLVNFDVVADPDLEEHQLYLVLADESNPLAGDNPTMQVIRKELSPYEITPKNLRYNPDCDCIQQTWDDGVTWVDNPGADPRSAPAFLAPPNATADPQCNSAANMVHYLHSLVDTAIAFDNSLQMATQVLALIGFSLGPQAGLILAAILIAVDLLLIIGAMAIEGSFTEETYDAFLCVFYCNIDADGQMSQDQLDAIYAQVATDFDTNVQLVFGYFSSINGPNGWSNAGSLGDITDADCSECECGWCWEWDFTISEQGWGVFGVYGEYVAGQGFRSVPVDTAYSLILVNGEAVSFTWQNVQLTVGYNIDPTFDGASIIAIGTTDGVTFPGITSWTPIATPNPNTYTYLAEVSIADAIYINPNGGDNSIVATVKSLRLSGIGTMPTFAYGSLC